MENQSSGGARWWMLLLALVGGIFLLQKTPGPAPEKPGPVVEKKKEGRQAAGLKASGRLLAPLAAFLGVSKPESTDDKEQPSLEAADLQPALKADVNNLHFLIVCVADPHDTGVHYRFDLQIDTLHKALAAERYVLDEYYLPWHHPDHDGPAPDYRREPGVLLYRKGTTSPSAKSDLLLVYLIGEVPTTGIHKGAFQKAVGQIVQLAEAHGTTSPPKVPEIMVAGTVFSGGAHSLALAIRDSRRELQKPELPFRVITGSAVALDREHFRLLASGGNSELEGKATLHSTVVHGTLLKHALIQYVKRRSFTKPRIAWLTETGTGYGSGIRWGESRAGTQAHIMEFPFPLNIARVRAIYEEQKRKERTGQPSLGPDRYRLRIPFDDLGTARDLPPMLTPNMTAPSEELVIGQILSTIRREGIEYVGISATDIRDPIFLAEIIHEHSPDVQILLVTSDVLALHHEYHAALSGALVASSHSLFPEDQDWCFPFQGDEQKVVVSNQGFYGLYNAVRILRLLQLAPDKPVTDEEEDELAKLDVMVPAFDSDHALLSLDLREEQSLPLLVEYGLPLDRGEGALPDEERGPFSPPVWVSMIGPDGIWPLTCRTAQDVMDGAKGAAGLESATDYTVQIEVKRTVKVEPATGRVRRDPAALTNDQADLLVHHFTGRIAPASYLPLALWAALGFIFSLAVLGGLGGNWARPLRPEEEQGRRFLLPLLGFLQFSANTFRCLIGLMLWAFITLIAALVMTPVALVGNWVPVSWFTAGLWLAAHFSATSVMAAVLVLWMGLPWPLWSRENRAGSLMAIGVATAYQIILAVWFWQHISSDEFAPYWAICFTTASSLWNGVSMMLPAQFTTLAIVMLAYGILVQFELIQGENLIDMPRRGLPPTSPATSLHAAAPQLPPQLANLRGDVSRQLLLPVVARFRQNRSLFFAIAYVLLVTGWFASLGLETVNTGFFPGPFNLVCLAFIAACLYWCLRLFKLVEILNQFLRQVQSLLAQFGGRLSSPKRRAAMLRRAKIPIIRGLADMLWTSRPSALDERRAELQESLEAAHASGDAKAELRAADELFLFEVQLFVRQAFVHLRVLILGLVGTGILLFLAANSFPFNTAYLMRFTTSVMLASLGGVLLWYYVRLDRDELVSVLVGTEPHQIQWNWSLLQTTAPAIGLALIALLSQAFPDLWQWLRTVLEPLARSAG